MRATLAFNGLVKNFFWLWLWLKSKKKMNFWWNETIVISSGENWRMSDVDENFCDENDNQGKLRATKITSDEFFTAKLFYRILLSGYFRNFMSLIKVTLPWHLKGFFTQGTTRNVLIGSLIIINNGNPQYLSKYRKKLLFIQVVAKNRYHRLKFAATTPYWNDL